MTDIFELALDAMAALEESTQRFANARGPWTFARRTPTARSRAASGSARRRVPASGGCSTAERRSPTSDAVRTQPPSDSRISSSSLMPSRRAAAFSNSSASERSNISLASPR